MTSGHGVNPSVWSIRGRGCSGISPRLVDDAALCEMAYKADVADRIIHLKDGRLSSATNAVIDSTGQRMRLLIEQNQRG